VKKSAPFELTIEFRDRFQQALNDRDTKFIRESLENANPADITQLGVVELEFGFAHAQVPLHQHQNTLEGLLKFALACDLEIRWDASPFSNQGGPTGGQSGIGDNWLGFQYRFHRQSRFVPTLAFGYDLKFPSASVSKGLGTGRYDHQFVFLASKDIKGIHFDFNASLFRVGRQDGSGSDINEEFNLAFSHPIYKNLGFTGEFYGDTRLGRDTVWPSTRSTSVSSTAP